MRAPAWTEGEFEELLQAGQRSSDEVSRLLQSRTEGATAIVQQGVHAFHKGQNISMLSQMMLRRLRDRARPINCPVCGRAAIR